MAHVTFVHGIANKPDPEVLLRLWREALSRGEGLDLGAEGISSSMVYWADVMYAEPQAELAEHESTDTVIATSDEDVEMSWRDQLESDERQWTDSLAEKMNFEAVPPGGDESYAPIEEGGESVDFERIPLPWWLKRRLMKTFLRDVHHYLFNSESRPRDGVVFQVQDEIRRRFIAAIEEGSSLGGPHVVVSHSMGTVIAYDCLKRVAECRQVDALMTIGSPLGLDEVQDKLRPEWSREDGFPAKVTAGSWVNVYDKLDPVAGLDPKFTNDYRSGGERVIEDINEQNYGRWRHNISKYLDGSALRNALTAQLDL